MKPDRYHCLTAALAFAPLLALPAVAQAAVVANPICTDNTAILQPNPAAQHRSSRRVHGVGFRLRPELSDGNCVPRRREATSSVSSWSPATAWRAVCNEQSLWPHCWRTFARTTRFTPDILVFNRNGRTDPRSAGQAYTRWRRVPARGTGGRHRLCSRFLGRAALRDRLQPVDPSAQRAKQQFAYRHRESDDRAGHPVHHQPADRRSPDRTARVQRRMDLLVAGIDDQQRRRRSRQWRRPEPVRHPVPGHHAEPERVRFG